MGMTSKLVEIEPGTTLHFWAPTINSTRPAVLFLHGFIANGIFTWPFQVLSLSSEIAVYVPDLLFFGDSFTIRPESSTSFQAECLAKSVMKLGVEKFSLVGFCYGSMVGFKLAQLYPYMVKSIVISGSGMELTESISNAILKNIGFTSLPNFLLPKTFSQVKVIVSIGTHDALWLPEFFYRHFFEVMFGNPKEKEELLQASVVSDKDATINPNYSQKIYILCGEDDKIFTKPVTDAMKEKLGEIAILEYLQGAGHLVQMERPCTYNHHLKKFLSESSDPANI